MWIAMTSVSDYLVKTVLETGDTLSNLFYQQNDNL
jgi:hypothetical protein